MGKIFIPGNVPSLKNSKIKTDKGIFPSKTVVKYLRSLGIKSYSSSKKIITIYRKYPYKFGPIVEPMRQELKTAKRPHVVMFHFVRDSKRKFDFINAVQIIADLLVAADIILDDDMDNFIPYPWRRVGQWYSYDKDKPGVWLEY